MLKQIADKRDLDKSEKADLEKNLEVNKGNILAILDRFKKQEVKQSDKIFLIFFIHTGPG